MRHTANRRLLGVAIGCGLLLRVLIPAGYMPAPLADGWPIQLCPDGLPAAAIEALLGTTHQHHHHHTGAGPEDDVGAAVPEQCELGAGFTTPVSVSLLPVALPCPALETAGSDLADSRPAELPRPGFRARAPPPATA